MIINIPNYKKLEIENIVLDYNGTIAKDGVVIEGVKEILKQLSAEFDIYVITADTHGSVKANMQNSAKIKILTSSSHTLEKAEFVKKLGKCAAVGNGNNDALMLEFAELAIAVMGDEGLSVSALKSADICVNDIFEAFALLQNPKRLIATLRK